MVSVAVVTVASTRSPGKKARAGSKVTVCEGAVVV
jgi:hypothetical protein